MNTTAFKNALRAGPYAWPGGYPIYFIASDGEALSFDAARQNARQIIQAIRNHSRCGWRVIATAINWEDADLYCAHTGERIQSAYGEVEHGS